MTRRCRCVGAYHTCGIQGVQSPNAIYVGQGGPRGAQGTQGVQGRAGTAQGTQGTQGFTGTQGVTGSQGVQGIAGAVAAQGIQGPQGNTGAQGTSGASGAQGAQGAIGTQGATGIGLQGVQGQIGAQGAAGSQGAAGNDGAQGTQGASGSIGVQGAQGLQGVQGAQGNTGSSGAQGSVGAQGSTGSQGTQGTQGIQGTLGTQGVQGITGASGSSSSIFAYKTNTTSQTPPPGEGNIQWNNSSQVDSTNIYVSHLTQAGTSGVQDIDVLLSNIKQNDILFVQDPASSLNYQEWKVSSAPSSVPNTYFTFPVTLLSSGGTGTTGFANNKDILIIVQTSGVQGTVGAQGAVGAQGTSGAQGLQGVQGTQGVQGDGVSLQQVLEAISNAALSTTDDLPEGVTNLYYKPDRVSYVHSQNVASSSWYVPHNLGFYPNITVKDSGGSIVEGEVTYTNANELTLTFSSSFSGTAYLS